MIRYYLYEGDSQRSDMQKKKENLLLKDLANRVVHLLVDEKCDTILE